MNIHTITSQGQGVTLGPVTIEKTFPSRPGAKNHFFLISDGSGKGALKIWGPDPHLSEGQSITITGYGPKGGLKLNEYPVGSGKTSIDANDCNVVINDGSAPAQQPAQEAAYQAPAQVAQARDQVSGNSSHRAKMEGVAKTAAAVTALYIDELVVNHGFSKDEALMLAQNAPGIFPLFWFGEKGIE